MKKLFILLIISTFSFNAVSQDEIKFQQIDSLNSFLRNNDSILAKTNRLYNNFKTSFYKEDNDTFTQVMMGISTKVNSIYTDYMNTEIEIQFLTIKESFLALLRSINDYNQSNLWKTEEYYNNYHASKKSKNEKEKEKADEHICEFFIKLDVSKEIFLNNYKQEVENLKNILNSGDKK